MINFDFAKRQAVGIDGAIHALAPISYLERRYSDSQKAEWKGKRKRMEKVRNNAMEILQDKAKYEQARLETRIANHSFRSIAIAQDRDARQVQKAISQYSQACNPQQFLDVDARIRGQLGGGQ